MNDYVQNIWLCVTIIETKCEHVFQFTISIAIKRLVRIWASHISSSDLMATISDFNLIEHPRECFICLCDLRESVAQLMCGHMFYCDCLSAWTKSDTNISCKSIDRSTTARYNEAYCANISSCPNCNRDIFEQKGYKTYVNIMASLDTGDIPPDVSEVLLRRRRKGTKSKLSNEER